MLVVNRTRGTLVGVDVARADSVGARMRGLYAYQHLMLGDGLWLVPCNNIQTIGMKHTIDVVFLDRELRVVRIYQHLRPGRFTEKQPLVEAVEHGRDGKDHRSHAGRDIGGGIVHEEEVQPEKAKSHWREIEMEAGGDRLEPPGCHKEETQKQAS